MVDNLQLIVIGGGPAGVTAALRARELGASVALIERGLLGGVCTNDGCVPTRVLAKAARLMRDSAQFAKYGLDAEQPTVDFARLLAQSQRTVYRMHEKKQLIDHLERSGARVFTNTGKTHLSDPHTLVLGDGTELRGEKIIIAAGGHARRLSFPGSQYTLTHSDVWSLRQLPRSVAVVGGAGTGCQVASILASFDVRVMLLNRDARLLPTEDALLADGIERAFGARGIEVVTGIGDLKSVERENGELTLNYTRGDQTRTLTAGAIIMSVGWIGNIEELNLEAAGVETARGYIKVDDYLQTSAPHIFAAGDITGRMMLVQSGGYEGRLAAENAILGLGTAYQHQIVPHGGFTDPEYASVGLTEEQARARGDCVVATVPYADVDRAVIDDHTLGFCKMIVSQESHRILGAHIVGEQALEAIQLVAAAMAADMWMEQLAEVELAYPTYTAIVGLAARQLCRQLGVIPVASQFRTLGRLNDAEWEWSEA